MDRGDAPRKTCRRQEQASSVEVLPYEPLTWLRRAAASKFIRGELTSRIFMTKRVFNSNFALYVLSALFLAGMASGQSGPIVWTAPSLQRVGPSDAAGSGTLAQLYAGKGEYESFQII